MLTGGVQFFLLTLYILRVNQDKEEEPVKQMLIHLYTSYLVRVFIYHFWECGKRDEVKEGKDDVDDKKRRRIRMTKLTRKGRRTR